MLPSELVLHFLCTTKHSHNSKKFNTGSLQSSLTGYWDFAQLDGNSIEKLTKNTDIYVGGIDKLISGSQSHSGHRWFVICQSAGLKISLCSPSLNQI